MSQLLGETQSPPGTVTCALSCWDTAKCEDKEADGWAPHSQHRAGKCEYKDECLEENLISGRARLPLVYAASRLSTSSSSRGLARFPHFPGPL